MKKFLLLFTLIAGFALMGSNTAQAQCTPDPTITSPGIYPDTLADGCVGELYTGVIDFVFPSDTTVVTPLGTFTVDFDSFVVSNIVGVPAGITYACNVGGNCVYVTSPPALTRGCVSMIGTPMDTTAYADSIEVTGDAWVTLFGQATAFSETFKLGIKIHPVGDPKCAVAVDDELAASTGLTVYPNPVEYGSVASYQLSAATQVKVELFNVYGQKVKDIDNGYKPAGEHTVEIFDGTLPSGVFFVKLTLNDGQAVITKKVLSVK